MKTYYISIEWISNNSKLYSVSVPDYFNKCAVKTILSQYTRYRVLVYDEPHYGFSKDDYTHMRSIERLIKAVKNVRFYKTEKKAVRTGQITSAKTFYCPSRYSIKASLEIKENYQPITFITAQTEARIDNCKEKHCAIDCLLKELKVRCSCIERLYLVGDWEVLKKSSCCKEEDGVIYDEYVAIEWECEIKEVQVEI